MLCLSFSSPVSLFLCLSVQLRYKISPLMRHCGAPVCFSDRSALDGKDGYVECPSYEDKSFSIRQMERHTAVQASGDTKHSSTQTLWYKHLETFTMSQFSIIWMMHSEMVMCYRKYPKNMCTQYEPREFSPEEKEHHLRSENMKNFIASVAIR